MKHVLQIVAVLACCAGLSALAQSAPPVAPTPSVSSSATNKPAQVFYELADVALQSMTKRAEELHIKGAALVAYIEGDSTKAWSSKMVVVGTMTNAPSEKNRGANLLAIAYAKAAEMATTLKDSGNAGRPPMTGELGWQGGLIKKGKNGYLLAAFSGGPSESDLKVSQAGLDVLAGSL